MPNPARCYTVQRQKANHNTRVNASLRDYGTCVGVFSTESVQQISLLVALSAGLLSFISLCVLPLFPAYLSFITGMSATEMHHVATL